MAASLLIISSRELDADLQGTVLWRDEVRRQQIAPDADAVGTASERQPNLVLIDARDRGACDLVSRLREDPRTRSLTIAALRPGSAVELGEELRRAGANAVLSTPIEPSVWDARLQRLLSVARRRELRVPVELQVWSLTPSAHSVLEGIAVDISERGLLLATEEPLEVGRKLDLTLRLPGAAGEHHVVAQVTRAAGTAGGQYRCRSGVEFLVLRGTALASIQRFVESVARGGARELPSERRQWEEALRTSEALRSAVVEFAQDAIVGIDHEDRIIEFNPAAEAIFRYTRTDVLGRSAAELLVPRRLQDAYRAALASQLASSEEPGAGTRLTTTGRRANGSEFPAELSVATIQLSGRRLFTAFVRDLTTETRREQALQQSRATQRALFAALPDTVLRIGRDGTYLDYRASADARPALPPEQFLGKRMHEVTPEVTALLMHYVDQAFVTGKLQTFDVDLRVDGEQQHREVRMTVSGPDEVLAIVRDVTERRRADERIRELAYRDPLTGLPNRVSFRERLETALAQAHRNQRRPCVLFIDLDRFKLINDSLGPDFGDVLLKAVAARLESCLPPGSTVARSGGDEFAVLLHDVAFAMDAVRVAGQICAALRQPVQIEGREIHVTASLGVAVYPDDGENADVLVKNADAAMYRAKERGRDRYELYAPELSARANDSLALETNLRLAMARNEMRLYYQPVIDGTTKRILGFEALLRWNHEQEGFISPADFVPVAEAVGLVVPIGAWALREACRQGRAWHELGHDTVTMAVNLSPRQFQQPDLEERILTILQETGFRPRSLHLEITEGSAMQSPERSVQILRRLKALGVHVSIDDFGVGHSSLNYLRRLPIDTLKIDQSFVRDIRAESAPIVTTVIAMARHLGLEVVAEGVETEAQRSFLSREGCRMMQGFLFSPARPAEECIRLLREQDAN